MGRLHFLAQVFANVRIEDGLACFTRDCGGLLGFAGDYLIILGITWDYWGLIGISGNYLDILGITWDYWGFFLGLL